MRPKWFLYFIFFSCLFLTGIVQLANAQQSSDSTLSPKKQKLLISEYIKSNDTLIQLETRWSTRQMEYRLYYPDDFKLFLSPNQTNNISLGFAYRYVDISFGFSPKFFNKNQPEDLRGLSTRAGLSTGFSLKRFYFSLEYSTVKGFYLKNSKEYARGLPDTPFLLFPNLQVLQAGGMVSYNFNPRFSTSALKSGSQVQLKSAWTFLPTFQFARFRFRDKSPVTGIENESTFSTDLNLLLPLMGTLVFAKKGYVTASLGPSIGIDFFKTLSYTGSQQIKISNGTSLSTGYLFQSAIGFNAKKFYGGLESTIRSYGHRIEDVDRLRKFFYSVQVYIGFNLRAPRWAKKSLDWANKNSPVKLE